MLLAIVPAAPPARKNQRTTSWPAPISANVPYRRASKLMASALLRVSTMRSPEARWSMAYSNRRVCRVGCRLDFPRGFWRLLDRQERSPRAFAGGGGDRAGIEADLPLVVLSPSRDLDVGLEVHHGPDGSLLVRLAEREV